MATSLLDIGPLTVKIKVRGTDQTVNPISAEHVFGLIWRFQSFRALMEGDIAKLSPRDLMGKLAPEALAAIMVACTGGVPKPTDDEVKAAGGYDQAMTLKQEGAEAIARGLGVDDQVAILEQAFKITFREEGAGPFVKRLRTLIQSVGPSGLEQAMSLQEELSGALQTVDPNVKSGNRVHARS